MSNGATEHSRELMVVAKKDTIDDFLQMNLLVAFRHHYTALSVRERMQFLEKIENIKTDDDAWRYLKWMANTGPEIARNQRRIRPTKLDLLNW